MKNNDIGKFYVNYKKGKQDTDLNLSYQLSSVKQIWTKIKSNSVNTKCLTGWWMI
jgi:hypothetical protein